ncbi:MAG: AbiEi antitoxin N-terminal domain-containing protein [Candidatus Thiodiazotropha sp. (ex Dulcina madagascariensis)]|nr:AbiEi antitoxin N-terminal domain-containing protein [Candidatus Thiodiazotropha sp. (ex Dulcina madagascariensis)]
MSKREQVIDYIRDHSIVRPKDLKDIGLPKDYLYQLSQEGMIERVGRGLYQWPGRDLGRHQSLIELSKQAPKAVVALLSALNFHDLTTQNPNKVWLAIDRKGWRPEISYPPVHYVTMSEKALNEGVETHKINGVPVKVFCPAKTVADCFKYRNKIGLDVALEALWEGWSAQKFTMDELLLYADICRVKKVIQPYLESLVA